MIGIIISIISTLFGQYIFNKLWKYSGIVVDQISREEAAFICMEREVVFRWRPQIVEEKNV